MKNASSFKQRVAFRLRRKNVISVLPHSITFVFCLLSVMNAMAQGEGGLTGTSFDQYVINNDNSNFYSRLRLQTSNYGWLISNDVSKRLTFRFATGTDYSNLGEEKMSLDASGQLNLSTGISMPMVTNVEDIHVDLGTTNNNDLSTRTVVTIPNAVNRAVLSLHWATSCYSESADITILVDVAGGTISPTSFSDTDGRGLSAVTSTATTITTPWLTSVTFTYNPTSKAITVTPSSNGCGKSSINWNVIGDFKPISAKGFNVSPMGVGIGNDNAVTLLEVGRNIPKTTKTILDVHGHAIFNNDSDSLTSVSINTDARVGNAALTVAGPTYIGSWTGIEAGAVKENYLKKYNLWVQRGIVSEDFVLTQKTSWKDEVFQPGYQLPTLDEVETFITAHRHLPGIPSEQEVKEKGYSVHEMNTAYLEKIEHLMLYSIEQQKKIKALETEILAVSSLRKELEALKEQIKK